MNTSPDSEDDLEESLITAIKLRNLDRIKYCLSNGANPNKICHQGNTPLGVAADSGCYTIFDMLADCQKKLINKKKSTGLKLDLGTNQSVQKNIGYYIVRESSMEFVTPEAPTPEGMAALEWDEEITEEGMNDEDLPTTPPDARIYKWYANVLDRTAIVLQSPDNDLGRLDRHGYNVLHYAVKAGHYLIVDYIINNFKEISVNQCDSNFFSPLQKAIIHGHTDVVHLLLERFADVNFTNYERRTPLHFGAQIGNVEIIKLLLHYGAKIDARDIHDCTPLAYAVKYEHSDAAVYLIGKGAPLNFEEHGETLLQKAVWNDMTEVAIILIKAGAKVIISHFAINTAITNNNFEIVRALHEAGAPLNTKDRRGNTPLMICCVHQLYKIAEYLLENGASPNIRNQVSGLTALHFCIEHIRTRESFERFFDLLVSHGADMNATSYMGNSLFYALIIENPHAAYVLIKRGIDVNIRDERSFVDNITLAKKSGSIELIRLMILAGYNFNNMISSVQAIPHTKPDELYDYIVLAKSNPLRLKELCRNQVRKLIGSNGKAVQKMLQLPLPVVTKRYLIFEEL